MTGTCNTIQQQYLNLFKSLNDKTNHYINKIEIKPIKIKNNIYVSGLKKSNITQLQLHVKIFDDIIINPNTQYQQQITKYQPNNDIYLDIELFSQDLLTKLLNDINTYVNQQLNNYTIATFNFKLKDNKSNNYAIQEDVTIYDDKKLACKDAIKLRKLSTFFKSKFIHVNDNEIINNDNDINKLTEEQLAELPLL